MDEKDFVPLCVLERKKEILERVLDIFKCREFIGEEQDYLVEKTLIGYNLGVSRRGKPVENFSPSEFFTMTPISAEGLEALIDETNDNFRFRRDEEGRIYVIKPSLLPLQSNQQPLYQMGQE